MMRGPIRAALLLISILLPSGGWAFAAPTQQQHGIGPQADFNGDNFGDLAIGIPGEDLGVDNSLADAGAV